MTIKLDIWLAKDRIPQAQGFVSVGSRRYAEWQNLAYQATTDEEDPEPSREEEYQGPMVEKPQYKTPEKVLLRTGIQAPVVSAVHGVNSRSPKSVPSDPELEKGNLDGNQSVGADLDKEVPGEDKIEMGKVQPEAGQQNDRARTDTSDDQVCVHESEDLCAEDID